MFVCLVYLGEKVIEKTPLVCTARLPFRVEYLRQRETHLVCLSCSAESATKALSLALHSAQLLTLKMCLFLLVIFYNFGNIYCLVIIFVCLYLSLWDLTSLVRMFFFILSYNYILFLNDLAENFLVLAP